MSIFGEKMQSKWYKNFRETPHCKMRMFCFPHAGGSAQDYKKWLAYLPMDIELLVAQMPGRAERMQEKLCTNFNELIDSFLTAIIPFLDKPYFFVGHSLGGSIAFEVARAIRRIEHIMPTSMIIIGRGGPNIQESRPRYNAPDKEFIAYLKSQSGTDEKIFEDVEVLKFFLPIIRNDMMLADTYHNFYQKESPLSCPIHVFFGSKEADITQEMVAEWKYETSSNFTVEQFDGNHFFLHEQPETVIKRIFELVSHIDKECYYAI